MKISRFISLSCLSLVLAGFSYQTSSYAEKEQSNLIISQSNNANNSAQIQSQAEKIIDAFFAQDFATVNNGLHPDLKVDLSTERLKAIWEATQAENGAFQTRKQSRVIDTPGSDLVIITVQFDRVTEDWIVIFNDQGQIIGADFPTSKNIDTIAREFIYSLSSGDFTQARIHLHPFLKESIFPQQIQEKWQGLLTQKGNFQQISSTNIRRGSTLDDTEIVELDLEFGKSDAEMIVIFDGSKSIIGVSVVE